jgi:ethanolaminephosphotransferase
MTVLFLVTFLFGQEIWFFRVPFLTNVTFTQLVEIIIYVFAIGLSLPFSLYNMYKAYINKTFKQPSIYEGVRPIFSTIYLFAIQYIWLKYSKSNIMELEPRVFFWITGTLFSNISVREITQFFSLSLKLF